MTNILALDVSHNCCSVAVSTDNIILSFIEEEEPHTQAEKLLNTIEDCLKKAVMDYSDIDYLAVTNGPGSFTGFRIGLATAHGICLASKIKPLTVSNLELFHFRAKEQIAKYKQIIVILNAYRRQIYWQTFSKNEVDNAKPTILSHDEAIDHINSLDDNTIISGTGIIEIYDQIHKNRKLTFLPRYKRIKATNICKYAYLQVKKNRVRNALTPLYIRPPDAKISKK